MFGGISQYDDEDDNDDYGLWDAFEKTFPHADFSKFQLRGETIIYKPTGAVMYKKGDFKRPKSYETRGPKKSKSIKPAGGFPKEYLLTKEVYELYTPNDKGKEFEDSLINLTIKVPQEFTIKLRGIFTAMPKLYSAADAKRWQSNDFKFYNSQLNFAIWCATKGCGVAMDMKHSFFRFHVIFTIRRILKELNVMLPRDRHFDTRNNPYDAVAYERLRKEFDAPSDFRFKDMGNVHVWSGGDWDTKKKWHQAWHLFSDEGGKAEKGNLILYVRPNEPYPWNPFVLVKGHGLTKAGMARINRSIEAFVYCILGAQVNTRSSIIGNSGSAEETRQQFLTLFESAIIENDISKGVQRYQMAIQKAKARLNFAVAPGCWLMPSNMVRNTHAVVGYNNKLQKATEDMVFGVNEINEDTTRGIPHVESKKVHIDKPATKPTLKERALPKIPEEDHDLLKTGLIAASVGLGYYIWR